MTVLLKDDQREFVLDILKNIECGIIDLRLIIRDLAAAGERFQVADMTLAMLRDNRRYWQDVEYYAHHK